MSDKVALEICESEFQRFLEAMDLRDKTEGANLDAEDKKSWLEVKATILNAMRRGSLVIDESGCPVFTPQVGDVSPVTFHEPTGAELMAMDQAKVGHSVARQNNFMGAISKQGPQRFAKMAMRDYKVCQSLVAAFLA